MVHLMEYLSQLHALHPWRNHKIRSEWRYKHVRGLWGAFLRTSRHCNRICHRNSPPFVHHIHTHGRRCLLQMAVLIYEQTQLVTNSRAPFGLWTVRENVCNPTVHSSARSNLVNYKFNVWKQSRIYASGCEIQLILLFSF